MRDGNRMMWYEQVAEGIGFSLPMRDGNGILHGLRCGGAGVLAYL